MKAYLGFIPILLLFCLGLQAQDQTAEPFALKQKEAEKIVTALNKKAEAALQDLDKASEKYLKKLLHQEQKLYKKILKKDSILAFELFKGVEEKYKRIASSSGQANKYIQQYSGHLDSLSTALNFLKGKNIPLPTEKLNQTLSNYSALQSKLNQTDNIKKFISERKKLLSQRLQNLGTFKQLNSFKKQAYYYSAQINEFKTLFEDPSKWERKLMELALGLPQFKNFFNKHSLLASLFPLPGAGSNGATSASFQGFQTRASVQQVLQTRFGSTTGFTQALQSNVQQAQGQINVLKTKLTSLGQGSFGNSDNVDLPKGFKPNTQKTKKFLQRLEYGANLQSKGSSSFIPVTTDLGLSLGYKFSDNSSLGFGAAYALGWGKRISNMKLTSEGMALRSYLDMKLKGSLFVSGGYEMNYRPLVPQRIEFAGISSGTFDSWQKSGLVGLSKKYKMNGKLKGEIKLLWDFLSYTQVPKAQALLFRVGYSLK